MSFNRELLHNREVYNIALVNETVPLIPNWNKMSWRAREHTIRRHHVVMFLCNTTIWQGQNPVEAEQKSLSGSGSGSMHSDSLQEELFRYKPLFLNPMKHSVEIQVGKTFSPGTDIYDMEANSEIRVTFQFGNSRSPRPKNCIAEKEVIVNLENGEISYVNMDKMVPGHDKAADFLSRRRLYMLECGMRIDTTDVDVPLKTLTNHESTFEKATKEWTEMFWKLRLMPPPPNIDDFKPELSQFDIKKLLNMMVKTSARQEGIIKWKGKLLPPMWVDPIISSSEKDVNMVQEFLKIIGEPLSTITQGEKILETLAALEIDPDTLNNFRFLSADTNMHPELIEALGIGHKTSIRDETNNSTMEREYPSEMSARYHPWFDALLNDLSCATESTPITIDFESDNNDLYGHPMDTVAIETCNTLISLYKQTYSSLFAATITNFYSRLGGAYRIKEKKGGEWISIMPLYYKTGPQERVVQGVALIAPQHNRVSSDKIHFLTIERLKSTPRNDKVFELALPFPIIKTTTGIFYVRSNSTNREDCEYRTFIHSALFLIANTIGEMCMNSTSIMSNENMIATTKSFIQSNSRWISERISENIMMGIIGGSQEEGMLAMLRKLFMLLYAREKGRSILMYSLDEFAEKINECAISNPLALYFHKSFCMLLDHKVKEESI